MPSLSEYLCADHARIEADLRAAAAPAGFAVGPYEAARAALLRHIAIEEKILLPYARAKRGGEPLPLAARLRKEHGAIASLLVPTPDAALVGELLGLLATHDALEEGAGGVYAQIAALVEPGDAEALLARAQAQPAPPLAPHFDGKGTHRTAESALRAHGLG